MLTLPKGVFPVILGHEGGGIVRPISEIMLYCTNVNAGMQVESVGEGVTDVKPVSSQLV